MTDCPILPLSRGLQTTPGCMAQFGAGVYLALACRTPPVRGEDRVHLRICQNKGSDEPPFRPLLRTPGMT
jgi:hypothetical protein